MKLKMAELVEVSLAKRLDALVKKDIEVTAKAMIAQATNEGIIMAVIAGGDIDRGAVILWDIVKMTVASFLHASSPDQMTEQEMDIKSMKMYMALIDAMDADKGRQTSVQKQAEEIINKVKKGN